MTKVYTHYDNLKVTRKAPPEVIRAAYKTLSQRFHPDKNPDDAEAARIMAIINTAYEVLSDPDKRQEHDLWIEKMEAMNSANGQASQESYATTQNFTRSPSNTISLSFFLNIQSH
jgi:DnaJ-class molecular chaperone